MLAARGLSPKRRGRKGRKDSLAAKRAELARLQAQLRQIGNFPAQAAARRAARKASGEARRGRRAGRVGAYRNAGRNAIVVAKAVRSGSPTSELTRPGDSVVSARASQIAHTPNQHGKKRQPGHAPVSILLRRIRLLELDILKRVKAGDVDSDEAYVAKKDPAEIKAFLRG
jgi:hypothetical protein